MAWLRHKYNRKQLELMVNNLFGRVFGDFSYISQKLLQQLLEQGIFMITRVRQNMKNKLMPMWV